MTKAADVAYGRRGGRWATTEGSAEVSLELIHRHRLELVAAGRWPAASLEVWRAIAAEAARRAPGPVTVLEQRALEVVAADRDRRR